MTSFPPTRCYLSASQAERLRRRLQRGQTERDRVRLELVRRHHRKMRRTEAVCGGMVLAGIVGFFGWIYWVAVH